MPKKRLGYLPLVCWLVLLPLAGCNLFTDLHHNGVDSDASVLTADGKSALARGDYNNAIVYFQRALDHDAGSSEARVGLAEAMVKAKQFNLAAFIQTLSSSSQTNGSANIPGMPNVPQLLKLSDWNCATYAELEQFFTDLINVLDPIAQGKTHGPYARNDPTVNLNAGMIYLLRVASRVQAITTANYQVVQITKNDVTKTPAELSAWVLQNLGVQVQFTQAQFDLLPNTTFYWISPTPDVGVLLRSQADVNAGIVRLQTAANTATSQKMIDDLVKMFSSLQIQVQ